MTGLTVDLLHANNDLWYEVLEHCSHDIYHRPGYCRTAARVDGGRALAVHVRSGDKSLLLPVVRRDIRSGVWDAVSPYGYPGPVWTAKVGSSSLPELFAAALKALEDDGCVSLFLRMHPWFNAELPHLPAGSVAHASATETVYIDLSLPDARIWSGTASGHRNEINRARKNGFQVEVDGDGSYLDEFAQLYRSNMRELGARPYYHFDDQYFHDLRSALNDQLRLIVVLHDGVVAGGALFMACGQWLQYHLSAVNVKYRYASPAKLIIDAERRWGQSAGYRWLHLGGGRGGAADSLLRFKGGFSPFRLSFRSAGFILRPDDFDRLMHEAGGRGDRFPAYRA